jgi:hypothetical protein
MGKKYTDIHPGDKLLVGKVSTKITKKKAPVKMADIKTESGAYKALINGLHQLDVDMKAGKKDAIVNDYLDLRGFAPNNSGANGTGSGNRSDGGLSIIFFSNNNGVKGKAIVQTFMTANGSPLTVEEFGRHPQSPTLVAYSVDNPMRRKSEKKADYREKLIEIIFFGTKAQQRVSRNTMASDIKE